MTPDQARIDAWLEAALADADKRGLPELEPLLESLAQAIRVVRAADFNDDASTQARASERS